MKTYGTLPDGNEVSIFILRNKNGMVAKVIEYGAILTSLEVPDKDGNVADVTHGYDTLEGWISNESYFGATAGRFGNRIAHGKFSLDDEDYSLVTNNDPGGLPSALHGGIKGFDKVRWSGESFQNADSNGVTLTYVSPDGEEGYPGTLTAVVTYTLNDDNELLWEAKATVEGKATPVNIIHHSYWNLSNDQDSSINDHLLTLNAKSFLPTNAGLIPTGEIAPVAGTPLDFTKPTVIGERVEADDQNLKFAGGYDHCWVLDPLPADQSVQSAAILHDPKTGRTLEVLTDQPGIQFYGGNFLANDVDGKDGKSYPHRSAGCLESQRFPDSPNQEAFPSSILRPGETYSHRMVHRFSW
ncbi:MAG: galactose mutarotase [Akkermansiaceae bacterium]|nr:galactose mutarotase [Akkermansiaceae bacterium]